MTTHEPPGMAAFLTTLIFLSPPQPPSGLVEALLGWDLMI